MFFEKMFKFIEDIILWIVLVIFSILLVSTNKDLIIIIPMLVFPLIIQIINIFKGNQQIISNIEYSLCAISFFSWFIANMISTGNLGGNFDTSINILFLIAGSSVILLLISKNLRVYRQENIKNKQAN